MSDEAGKALKELEAALRDMVMANMGSSRSHAEDCEAKLNAARLKVLEFMDAGVKVMREAADEPLPTWRGVPKRPERAVFVVTERTTPEGVRSFWTKIGAAHDNRDGSTTLKLDALPLSGTLQVRDGDGGGR